MEYVEQGNLLDLLHNEAEHITEIELLQMASDTARGMNYLHSQNVVHRDLAARNLLVDRKNTVKVSDFGLSRVMSDELYTSNESKVPIKWSSPESLKFNKFTTKSDAWSFGVALYEIMTYGAVPYVGMSNKEVVDEVEKGYRLPKPTICSSEAYELMMWCWHTDANQRPDFKQISAKLSDFLTALKKEKGVEDDRYADPKTLRNVDDNNNGEELYNNIQALQEQRQQEQTQQPPAPKIPNLSTPPIIASVQKPAAPIAPPSLTSHLNKPTGATKDQKLTFKDKVAHFQK